MSHEDPRRYLSCSTLNGRLYLSYVMALDGTAQVSYWTREDALKVFESERGDRLIHSVADLDAAVQLSLQHPLRMVFVAEALEEEVRRRITQPPS
jgi:hypothetical protein